MDIDTQGGEVTVSAVDVAVESAGALSATVPLDAQMGNASEADWQEEVYQKIKSMKEMYLSELNDLYQKIASKVQQSPHNEQIEKLKMFKMTLECILLFLRLNKHDIQPAHKEKLLAVERHISFFLSSNRPCKPSSSDALQQSLSKQREQRMLPQCNQLLLMQQELFQRQQLMQQQQAMNSLQRLMQHNSLSDVFTTSNSQQHILNSLQQGTALLPTQMRQQMEMKTVILQQQQLMQQQQALQVLQQQMGMKTLPMEFEPYTSTVEDYSVLMRNANGADWQEEVYQKIKSMRETHLSEINDLYQKIASVVQQRPQHEQIEKLKMFKMTLERIVLFLRLNKHEIQLCHKEKLFVVEKHISFFLSYKRPHEPTSSPLQGQLPQPSMHTSQR